MIVGGGVVEMTTGITAAPDQASPVEPVHPQLVVDDRHAWLPIMQVQLA